QHQLPNAAATNAAFTNATFGDATPGAVFQVGAVRLPDAGPQMAPAVVPATAASTGMVTMPGSGLESVAPPVTRAERDRGDGARPTDDGMANPEGAAGVVSTPLGALVEPEEPEEIAAVGAELQQADEGCFPVAAADDAAADGLAADASSRTDA